jgi:hypothetical protein
MKTCHQFKTVRAEYEREISYMIAHSEQHQGRSAAKSSAKHAASTKARMARALSSHVERCPECG